MSEIAFVIHPQASKDQGCLVLELVKAIKERFVYQLSPSIEGQLPTYWRSLALSSGEKELLALLFKEEMQIQQRGGFPPPFEKTPIKKVRVSPAQTQAVFQLLAPTQKLFCKGKQLAIDLYGSAEFYYQATSQEGGSLAVDGRVRWRNTDISVAACEAIGPGKPHWFLYGISLKMIATAMSWKTLQEALFSPRILSGPEKQAFLEGIDANDPDSPQLVMVGGTLQEAVQQAGPFPVLILKDRWGAFADLWMDYGNGVKIPYHDPSPLLKDRQGKLLFKRQGLAEDGWEKDLLETDFIKKMVDQSHYYCPMDRVAKSLTFLLEVGWQIEDWQGRRVVKQTGWDLRFEELAQKISVKGQLSYDSYQADVKTVLGAFNRREQFIQLSPDAVGLLPINASRQALQDLADQSEIVGEEVQMRKSRFGALDRLWEYGQSSPTLSHLKEKWHNFSGVQEAAPGPSFLGKLRPYQQAGVNWLAFLQEYGFHGILADEMGLGKTVQILAFLSRIPKGRPHLIVLPTSLLFNWKNEIGRFLPSFSVYLHHGPQRTTVLEDLQVADVILTSYTTLRLDLSLIEGLEMECLILDEAQMIKNAATQTAQSVCRLKAGLRLCLTGTPVENHLEELWSHFHFLIPDLFGSREDFEAEIQAGQADNRYLEKIKKKIAPFLLRRRKKEVAADLPERIDQVVWVEMEEEQRKVYDQMLAGFKSGLLKKVALEGVGKHRMEVLEAILRLRQVCCHPVLVSSLTGGSSTSSAKFEALLEDLGTIVEEEGKVLVYSQFTSMLKLMAQAARERQWNYCYLDGATKNREEEVAEFQSNPAKSIFFISLKAGGVGLNLTAADYVYLYDPWWNEAVEEQAINRAHRIGRESHVIAKRFVVAESVEERMMKMKASKRLMIDDLLENDSLSAQISLDDLQFLIS